MKPVHEIEILNFGISNRLSLSEILCFTSHPCLAIRFFGFIDTLFVENWCHWTWNICYPKAFKVFSLTTSIESYAQVESSEERERHPSVDIIICTGPFNKSPSVSPLGRVRFSPREGAISWTQEASTADLAPPSCENSSQFAAVL